MILIHINYLIFFNLFYRLRGQLTTNGSNFHVLFIWLELFSNMFSVIVWKQNFEERNRAGAIPPLLPIGCTTIPLHHYYKCSNFQTVMKFEVFSTSSSFSCLPLSNRHLKWLPVFYESRFLCDYLVLYCENRKISMNEMLLLFHLHLHTKFQEKKA